MKLLSILLMFSVTSLWAAGGVDVGNGTRPLSEVGINIPSFEEESDMAEHVRKLMPKIHDGSLRKIHESIKTAECSRSGIGFKELETFTVYEFNKAKHLLDRRKTGHIIVTLKDCAKPNLIKSDEKPKLMIP